MTTTLNFHDHLLSLGRKYQEVGRFADAETVLGRLSGFRELPAAAAEEAQARLAELHLRRRQFARARRCLTAALAHQPDSARYHLLMATALQADDRGDLERADEHYRRSLELDPKQAKCQSDAGLLAVRLGRTEEGLTRLRQAVEQAPDDVEAVRKLVKGLRLADRGDEARDALRAGLFRNPRNPPSASCGKITSSSNSAAGNRAPAAPINRPLAANPSCCRFAGRRAGPPRRRCRKRCVSTAPPLWPRRTPVARPAGPTSGVYSKNGEPGA